MSRRGRRDAERAALSSSSSSDFAHYTAQGTFSTNIMNATWHGPTRKSPGSSSSSNSQERYGSRRKSGRSRPRSGTLSTSSADSASSPVDDNRVGLSKSVGYTHRSERVPLGLSSVERKRLLRRADFLSSSHDDVVLRSLQERQARSKKSGSKRSQGTSKKSVGKKSVAGSGSASTKGSRQTGTVNDDVDSEIARLTKEIAVVKRSKDSLYTRMLGDLANKDKRIRELEQALDGHDKYKEMTNLISRNREAELERVKDMMEAERKLWYKELKMKNHVALPVGNTPKMVPEIDYEPEHSREFWTPPATAVLERQELGMPTSTSDVAVDGLSTSFIRNVLKLKGDIKGARREGTTALRGSTRRTRPGTAPSLRRTSTAPSPTISRAAMRARSRLAQDDSALSTPKSRVSSTRSALENSRSKRRAKASPSTAASTTTAGGGVSARDEEGVPGEGLVPYVGAHGFTIGETRTSEGGYLARLSPLWSTHKPNAAGHTLTIHDRRLRIARVGGGFVEVEEDIDGTAEVRDVSEEARGKYREMKIQKIHWEGLAGYYEELLSSERALRRLDASTVESSLMELREAEQALKRLEGVVERILESGINPEIVLQRAMSSGDGGQTAWERIADTLEALAGQIVSQNNEIDSLRAQIKHYQQEEEARLAFKRDCFQDASTITEHIKEEYYEDVVLDLIDETLADLWEDIVLNAVHEAKEENAQAQKELLYMPETIDSLIATKVEQPRIKSLSSVLQTIRQLYNDKIVSDATDDREGLERLLLSDFVYESFTTRYGLQSLTDAHVVDFMASVNFHRGENTCVQTFGSFLHQLPTTSLNFYLFAYETALNAYPGATFLNSDTGTMLVAKPAVISTTKHALEGLGDDIVKPILSAIRKHEAWQEPTNMYIQAHRSVAKHQVIDLFVYLALLLHAHEKEETRRIGRLRKSFRASRRDYDDLIEYDAFKALVRQGIASSHPTTAAAVRARIGSKQQVRDLFTAAIADTNKRRGQMNQVGDRIDATAYIAAARALNLDNQFRWGEERKFVAGVATYGAPGVGLNTNTAAET